MNVERERPAVRDTDDVHVRLGPTSRNPSDQMSRAALGDVVDDLGLGKDGTEVAKAAVRRGDEPLSTEDARNLLIELTKRPKALSRIREKLIDDETLENLQFAVKEGSRINLTKAEIAVLIDYVISSISVQLTDDHVNFKALMETVKEAIDLYSLREHPSFDYTMENAAEYWVNENRDTARTPDAGKAALIAPYLSEEERSELKDDVIRLLGDKLYGAVNYPLDRSELLEIMKTFGISSDDLQPKLNSEIRNSIGMDTPNVETIISALNDFGISMDSFKPDIIDTVKRFGISMDPSVLAEYISAFKITESELREAAKSIEF